MWIQPEGTLNVN